MKRNQLEQFQDEKLREILPHQYQAPIIEELWENEGLQPADVRSTKELRKAPIFRKNDVREYIERGDKFGGRLTDSLDELSKQGSLVATSSGTTGKPTNMLFTEEDLEKGSEWCARHLWLAGVRPGDLYVNLMPARDAVTTTLVRGANKIGANVTRIEHNESEVHRLVHVLEELEPTVVNFLSSPFINALRSFCEETDRDLAELFEPVKSFTFSGGPLIDEYRHTLEEDFEAELFEFGGSLEPRWTCIECETHDGFMHVPDDHFFLEIIDPETEERVEDGNRGELVITPLSYRGMGHVRWGHDDIIELGQGKCKCGRTTSRVNFLGRSGDLVKVVGKSILPYDVLPIVNGLDGMPNNYFQFYKSSNEELKMRIGYDEDIVDNHDDLARQVVDMVESELDVPVNVVETLPEPELEKLGPEHKVPYIYDE